MVHMVQVTGKFLTGGSLRPLSVSWNLAQRTPGCFRLPLLFLYQISDWRVWITVSASGSVIVSEMKAKIFGQVHLNFRSIRLKEADIL